MKKTNDCHTILQIAWAGRKVTPAKWKWRERKCIEMEYAEATLFVFVFFLFSASIRKKRCFVEGASVALIVWCNITNGFRRGWWDGAKRAPHLRNLVAAVRLFRRARRIGTGGRKEGSAACQHDNTVSLFSERETKTRRAKQTQIIPATLFVWL